MRFAATIVAAALVIVGILLYVETRRAPAPVIAAQGTEPRDALVAMQDASVIEHIADAAPDAAADASITAAFHPAALEALRNSGTASDVWIPDATRLVHAIAPAAAVECYVAGCAAQLGFTSEAAYQDAVRAIREDHTWTGGKLWTDAARRGGRITVALILYRPD